MVHKFLEGVTKSAEKCQQKNILVSLEALKMWWEKKLSYLIVDMAKNYNYNI